MDIFFWRLYIYSVLLKTIHTFFFCLLSFYKTLKALSGNSGPGALLDFVSLNFTLWSLKLRMKFKFGLWNCSIPENCSYHSSKVRPKGPGRIRHSSAISLFFFSLPICSATAQESQVLRGGDRCRTYIDCKRKPQPHESSHLIAEALCPDWLWQMGPPIGCVAL